MENEFLDMVNQNHRNYRETISAKENLVKVEKPAIQKPRLRIYPAAFKVLVNTVVLVTAMGTGFLGMGALENVLDKMHQKEVDKNTSVVMETEPMFHIDEVGTYLIKDNGEKVYLEQKENNDEIGRTY